MLLGDQYSDSIFPVVGRDRRRCVLEICDTSLVILDIYLELDCIGLVLIVELDDLTLERRYPLTVVRGLCLERLDPCDHLGRYRVDRRRLLEIID